MLIGAGLSPSSPSSPVYYAPRPSYPAPSQRYTPPAPRASPETSGTDFSALEAFANSDAGQQQLFQSQAQQQEPSGFWGSGFGKGLGYVINNPVTRAVSMPINYLQIGGRLATLGLEEATEALAGGPTWAQNLVGQVPGLGQLMTNVDTGRTEADTRSNWEKVLSPNTTYGYGELLPEALPKWASATGGLIGDVALDPLTYIGGGAARITAGASHVDEAARGLDRATELLRVAEEAGDAKQVAKATEQLARAEEYAARAPTMPTPQWEMPLPRNRAERANLLGELTATPEGRQFLTEMPGEATRAGTRGFQTISPEAKQLIGIQEPGLRIRGMPQKIPLSGPVAELLNWGGGSLRQGLTRVPGMTGTVGAVRTPKGLENAFNVLTRDVDGDLMRAASEVYGRNQIRLGTGQQLARGNRTLVHGIKEFLKGKDKSAIQRMVTEAETLPEANGINTIASRLLDTYQKVTGRVIDPEYLRDPATYFPHLLDPKWRRTLARMAKRGDRGAADFLEATGIRTDELLEDPAFYADNLLEGSGFLEKARKLGLDKDGNPQTFAIGGKEITFEANDVGHINEKLREAFPTYKGDFYDTDPVRVFEAYNTSLARQAGRDLASRKMVEVGNPLAFRMTGDIDATRKAMNEALSQQDAAPLLSTAQGKYDPTQPLPTIPTRPVVPGSVEDKARREQIAMLEAAARGAATPEEAAAMAAEAAAAPAPPARIGGVDPGEYFVTTKGEAATAERNAAVTRAKTYATAAAAETAKAEERLRSKVYDLREMIISPLKTNIKQMDGEVRAINTKVRQWGKTVTDMGDLNPENLDEMSAVLTKVEAEINNIETKLKRTRSAWKGRATRQQRSAEAKMRKSLESLREVRDQTRAKVHAAPEAMREELLSRERILNQPVRDANERLLRAEMEIPVPHYQKAVDDAMAVIERGLAEGEDPEELLERYRTVIQDAYSTERAIVEASPTDTPAIAHQRQVYGQLLDEIKEIGTRTKKGRLSKVNQSLMDEAQAKLKILRDALARGETVGGGPVKMSAYDEAMNELAEARRMLTKAQNYTPPTQAEIAELTQRIAAGEQINLMELGGGAGAGDVPRLQAEINRMARQFRSGGRFAEEHRARAVVKDMGRYAEQVAEHTQVERAELTRRMQERATRQEAIIWATPTKGHLRYVTGVGENPSALEGMGWGVGQTRYPEPIETPPQWLAHQEQAVNTRGQTVGVPPPRTEQEALTSLRSQIETGGQAQMEARRQARNAERTLAEAEAAAPDLLAEEQAGIRKLVKEDEARELGPLAERAQTYTNLASDLSDRRNLVAKREEARALRDRIRANPKNKYANLIRVLDDLEAVAKANPYMDDPKLNQVESLLQTHRTELERISETRMRVQDLDRVVADAKNGELGNVMIATLNNNWKALHGAPANTGDIIMDAQLHKAFTNLFELNRQPKALGRVFNAFTNLFKTYATLSPGFFVRNTIGGVFMNTADGVGLLAQEEGARLWQTYMKRGEAWLDKQPPRVQDSFAAAMASGAGGRFEESGVLAKTQSRLYNVISSNPVTRRAQRWGTRVEGGMRLGMALDSIDNGMSVQDALQRITRVHFDYSQVSELDETMKRIIPFWTFMSRNLPLQIQEQWTNPRVYSYYNNLVNNFRLPDEEFTPDYWTRQGAWRTPIEVGGNPLYAQPDLGFTRVQQDIEMLGGALGGDNPGQLFSQANPLIGATLDFMNKRDSFYNRAYDVDDYTKQSGVIGAPVSMLARLLGQTNEMGQVSDNFTNYLASLAPPLNQANRLFPGASGGEANWQTAAKWARYGGIPIQLLTPEAQDSEYWRQWRAMQDEEKARQAMLEEAAS